MTYYEPAPNAPQGVKGEPTTIRLAEVTTVNADGSADVRPLRGRGGKVGVRVPTWYMPAPGDRVLIADLDGSRLEPVCLGPYSPKDGALVAPTNRLSGIWTPFPFSANFDSVIDGQDQVVQYRVSGAGDVQIRGVAIAKVNVTMGFGGTPIGTLPPAAVPPRDHFPLCYGNDSGPGGIGGCVFTAWIAGKTSAAPGRVTIYRENTGRVPVLLANNTVVGFFQADYSTRE